MVKTILGVLSLLVMSSCSTVVKENTAQPDIMETKIGRASCRERVSSPV